MTTQGRPRRRLRAAVQQRLALPRRRPQPGGAATTAAGGDASGTTSRSPVNAAWAPARRRPVTRSRSVRIDTNVPGIDFTWISSMAKAYFDCVNDNGGINGRPIEYIDEDEHIDPAEIAGLAKKLARARRCARLRRQHEHHRLQRQRAVLRRQRLLPDHRGRRPGLLHDGELLGREHGPVLLEPRWRAGRAPRGAKGTIVIVSPNQPGIDVINSGVIDFAKAERSEGRQPHRRRADRRPRSARAEAGPDSR